MKRYFLVANGLEIMFQRVWYHLKKRMEDSNFATFCAKLKQNRQLIWATISPRGRTQVNWLLLWHTENSFSFGKRSRNCMEEKINNSLSCFLFQLFFSTFSSSTASSSWPNKTRQNYRVLVSLIWKKKTGTQCAYFLVIFKEKYQFSRDLSQWIFNIKKGTKSKKDRFVWSTIQTKSVLEYIHETLQNINPTL